ncbi:unknown; predicted coding region [Mycoplasmopsis pulmonis]|uniref:Uncharacterized protein n=1 Tax=Mycoplasmopsis pulmonis (strain UAB CTIP) TaxID=272635 RepID=Q98QE6_MYCPU|nr:hypothetical protein [Mycoplasmopsis pulmonis]CAC13593.1 unknown; predicted coding region [Mycoplasmopsis pulmonis]
MQEMKPDKPKDPEKQPEAPENPDSQNPPAKPEDPKAPEKEKEVIKKKLVYDKIQEIFAFTSKHKQILTTLTSPEKLKNLSLDSYAKEFEELSKMDEEFVKFYQESKHIFESDVAIKELKFTPINTSEWISRNLPGVKIAKKMLSSVSELKKIKEEYSTKVSQIAKKGEKSRIETLKKAVEVAKKGYEWLTQGFDSTNPRHKEAETILSSLYEKIFANVKEYEKEIANPEPEKPKEEKPIDLKHVLISKEEVEDWIKNEAIYSLEKKLKNLSYFNGRTFDSTSSYKIFRNYILQIVDGSSNKQFTEDENHLYRRTDYLAEEYYSPLQANNRINAFWGFQWRQVTKSKETNWKNITVHTRTAGENKFDKTSLTEKDELQNLQKLQIMHDLDKSYIRVSYVYLKYPEKPNSNYKPIEKKVEPKKPDWRLITVKEITDFVKDVKQYDPEEQLRRAAQFGYVTFENTTAVKVFTDFLKELLKDASVAYIDKDGNLLERKDYKFEEYYFKYKENLANAHLVVQWTHSKKIGDTNDKTYWFHRRLKGAQKEDLEFAHWFHGIDIRHNFPDLGPDYHYIWFNYYLK